MTSAVTLAVAPTVSLRSSSWIRPSTLPSTSRSSCPVISPFTCRLGPNRARALLEEVTDGRSASVLIFVAYMVAGAVVGGVARLGSGIAGGADCSCCSGFFPHMGPPWTVQLHQKCWRSSDRGAKYYSP